MNAKTKLLCSVMLMSCAGAVSAATSWTLTNGPSGALTQIAGYANTFGSGTANTQTIEEQKPIGNSASPSYQNYPGGIGIANRDGCATGGPCEDPGDVTGTAPEHAIDNEGRYEMALLSFSSKVNLTGVTIGWPTSGTYDTDITVMAYKGATPFDVNTNLVGKTYGQLIGAGWANVGNYSDMGSSTGSVSKPVNAGNLFSSYWLVGAYNPLANPNGGSVTGTPTSYDYIKLSAITVGTICTSSTIPGCSGGDNGVPEPGSLALVGAAALGLLGLRRRSRA